MKPPRALNILVTGGAGFIGGHVVRAYLREGHRVVVLDDLSTGSRSNVPKEAIFIRGDLETVGFATLLGDHAIDLVNHHAAHIDVRASVAEPVKDARTNVLGSLRLLEGCRRAGVRRFIFASTGGAIYGEPLSPAADETHATDPVSPYGVSKLAIEKYLHVYRVEHGFQTVVFRYANVYGPGQSGHGEAGVVAILLERMLTGRTPVIHGDGEQTRDFVFIRDCAQANLWALGIPGSGLWNVGTGIETSVNRLFALLCEVTGKNVRAAHDAAAPGEQRRSVLNGEKYLRDFAVPSYTPLRAGLSETVAQFPPTA